MANETITDSSKEQDRFLPLTNVGRIMKKSLPKTAKISKETKETVQECVSEFISFITDEASDKCLREKKKTINGDDLLWAMTTLGFENYVRPLKVHLDKYRETQGQGEYGRTSNSISGHDNANGHDKVSNFIATKGDLQGFNSGFYSVEAQVVPNSFRDERKSHQPGNKELELGGAME